MTPSDFKISKAGNLDGIRIGIFYPDKLAEIKDVNSTPLSGVRIDVTGPNGFAAQLTSDAMGKWQVEVASTGIYDVTLDQASLPAGQALTDISKGTRKVNVLMLGNALTILFPIGPGAERTPILDQSVQLLADGLILGIIIALAALGLNLVFGTTGLTNFASIPLNFK